MADLGVEGAFSMHSGDSRVIELTINLQDDSGPENITGAAITFALSKQDAASTSPKPSGTALVTKTVGSGITIVNGPNGRADVVLAPADTAALKAGAYYYEVQVVISGSTATTHYGQITVLGDLVE